MRRSYLRPSALIRNMDVSALAAVLFVLLFAFIMLTETPHDGVSADLPKAWHPISMPGARREDAMTVDILRDGTVYFGQGRVRSSDLASQIRRRVGRGAEKKLYIRADARASYITVREVLDEARSAGVEKVAFLVAQRRPRSEPLIAGSH